MTASIVWLSLSCFVLAFYVESRPLLFHSEEPYKSTNWLWNWTFGGGTTGTVSVVERSPVISYEARPAAFGPQFQDPILGYIIPLSSFTVPCRSPENNTVSVLKSSSYGCPDLCLSGPDQPEPSETWIALVQRGQCEFTSKVREAQRLGAKAVVVGGGDPDETGMPDTLLNMFSPEDASDIVIPSTYITFSSYSSLTALIKASNTSLNRLSTLSILITAEYSVWEWYSPIVTFFVILILPSVITLLTLLIHRIRTVRQERRERAPQDVVRKLPMSIWNGKHAILEKHFEQHAATPDELEEGEGSTSSSHTPCPWYHNQVECAICLSEFALGDKVRILPCHHIFHLDEIDEWLIKRKKLCPICKFDVTQEPAQESTPATATPENPVDEEADHAHPTERTPLLPSSS